MLTLPPALMRVMIRFRPLFAKRVWARAQVLLVGAILAPGKRTVTAALRVMGLSEERHFQNYHRVLNRAAWSSLGASRVLLGVLVESFAPAGPLILALDDTIERRRGARIKAKGIYRDPVRSSHSHFAKASGLRWLSLMLAVRIPWAERVWALPVLTALCPSERYYRERGRGPVKLTGRARQMLLVLRRWLPDRALVVVADASFAALELLDAVRRELTVVTRLRLDAALYDPAPIRRPGTTGRPRKKGARRPTLKQLLAEPATVWRRVTIRGWYGEPARDVELASQTAVWVHSGRPAVPIRWVLVRDVRGEFEPQALLCTDVEAEPAEILRWFVRRWQTEVTFEEARAHLGVETQRQWSDRAIARTTPALLALYSLVTVLAHRLVATGSAPARSAAWYAKERPTFSDAIALVRRCLWGQCHFSTSAARPDVIEIPRVLFDRLTETLCYAA